MQLTTRLNFVSLLLLSACSQSPAAVELDGQNTYGRSYYASLLDPASQSLYSYSAPSSAAPANSYVTTSGNVTQRADIQPVGVHDLANMAPAAGGQPKPSFTTAAASAPLAPTVESLSSPSPSPVNPWTKQPHFSTAEAAPQSHKTTPRQLSVAQLDHIIANSAPHAAADTAAFIWPVDSKRVISGFGPKGDGKTNDGINIAASEGEPVWAVADGEVAYVGNELPGYGNMVLIRHSGGKVSAYAHLNRAAVDKYDHVKQGDIIGYVGSTGNVREPQLHFAIRGDGKAVDPMKYLSQSMAAN